MSSGAQLAIKIVALLLHLAAAPFYLAAGLIVPLVPLVAMWAAWIALLVVIIVKWKNWRIVGAVPIVAAALWFGVPTLGSALFGWTA